jgi:uncharacterized protein
LIRSPKLYFYDVGLASYLLGLQNENHVSRDPLRGNLFENLAVVEALKFRFNRGMQSNLSFYRDSSGHEVDLILELGPDIFPLEIKAGETIPADAFRGLKSFARVVPEWPQGGGLIYGGSDDRQSRSNVKIYPVMAIHELLKSLSV